MGKFKDKDTAWEVEGSELEAQPWLQVQHNKLSLLHLVFVEVTLIVLFSLVIPLE